MACNFCDFSENEYNASQSLEYKNCYQSDEPHNTFKAGTLINDIRVVTDYDYNYYIEIEKNIGTNTYIFINYCPICGRDVNEKEE